MTNTTPARPVARGISRASGHASAQAIGETIGETIGQEIGQEIARPAIDATAARLALFCSVALLACAAIAAFVAATSARAQDANLPDPTRPPAAVLVPREDAAVAPAGPVLQSVIIADGRRGAIISGQYVALGARYGDTRLTQVSEASVVLRGASGAQTLTLYPSVDIRRSAAQVPARAAVPAGSAGSRPTADAVRREGKVAP